MESSCVARSVSSAASLRRKPRRPLVAALIFGTFATGCAGVFGNQRQASTTGSDPAAVRHMYSHLPPAVPFVATDSLLGAEFGQGATLSPPASAPLMGWLGATAVPSPDGSLIAYNSWERLVEEDPNLSFSDQGIEAGDSLGTPSIWLHDVAAGTSSLIRSGAYSIAWNDSGFAHFEGVQPNYRANVPFTGHIWVRSSPEAIPVRWTLEESRYIVLAWAGNTLIAYREREGEAADLLALDGPGAVRPLAPLSLFAAASPDGASVAIMDRYADPLSLRVVDVATGAVSANVSAGSVGNLTYLGYSGDWLDDTVAIESDQGIALFRVADRSIELSTLIPLPLLDYPLGIHEPTLVDNGTRVTGWAPNPRGGPSKSQRTYRYVDCDIERRQCTQGPETSSTAYRRVHNPSRP